MIAGRQIAKVRPIADDSHHPRIVDRIRVLIHNYEKGAWIGSQDIAHFVVSEVLREPDRSAGRTVIYSSLNVSVHSYAANSGVIPETDLRRQSVGRAFVDFVSARGIRPQLGSSQMQ